MKEWIVAFAVIMSAIGGGVLALLVNIRGHVEDIAKRMEEKK